MSSRVEGCTTSPRKSRRKSACFSSTVTLTPARASKKPSIMPAGPPPAMQQVVLIEIVTADRSCGRRIGRREQFVPGLGLLVGSPHHETVEFITHFYLARQAGIGTHVIAEVEHVFFHWRRSTGFFAPGLIDVDMTGCTGTRTAAFGLDPRNIVAKGRLHHRRAVLGFDRAGGPAGVDISDLSHGEAQKGVTASAV